MLLTAFIVTLLMMYVSWRATRQHILHVLHVLETNEYALAVRSSVQNQGIRVVSWVVSTLYKQVDGLQSVEAVLSDGDGHEILVEVTNPNVVSAAAATAAAAASENHDLLTVGDFIRIIVPSERAAKHFRPVSARLVVVYDGQRHVVNFNQGQMSTLFGVVLDSVRNIQSSPLLDNQTLEGEPVRATLSWENGDGDGVRDGVPSHHNVLEAVASLVGPKGRWWNADADGRIHKVTGEAVVRESLRQVYGLRCTDAFLRHHVRLDSCSVKIVFSGRRFIVVKSNTPCVLPPPRPTTP
jgi:hypothetical protein